MSMPTCVCVCVCVYVCVRMCVAINPALQVVQATEELPSSEHTGSLNCVYMVRVEAYR